MVYERITVYEVLTLFGFPVLRWFGPLVSPRFLPRLRPHRTRPRCHRSLHRTRPPTRPTTHSQDSRVHPSRSLRLDRPRRDCTPARPPPRTHRPPRSPSPRQLGSRQLHIHPSNLTTARPQEWALIQVLCPIVATIRPLIERDGPRSNPLQAGAEGHRGRPPTTSARSDQDPRKQQAGSHRRAHLVQALGPTHAPL